jgi:prolyl-tRNA synthetase
MTFGGVIVRYSQAFISTVREVPAEAEIPSHQLMIRAGLMRKLASGMYSYLPLGWRVLKRVMNIVRNEMDASGALEILLPSVQPMELWQRTGRDADYGETMCKFKDRHGRLNVLAPTAEEVVTHVISGEINSYKQMPVNVYQISFKFRDEFRPRFGVLRSREFIMKDAYSFHSDEPSLEQTYRVMYETYKQIFKKAGVPFVIVEAETGEMGGSGSHQFTVPCESGEDVIVYTEDGSYAANIEKAAVDAVTVQPRDPHTPAASEVHTPNVGTIDEVCAFLKTQPQQMIKTIIYSDVNGKTIAVLVRGDHEINAEKLTQAVDRVHTDLADEATIRRATGAAVGFAGPIGLAARVDAMLVDASVAAMAVGISGANKTDYHTINVVPGRDFALSGGNVRVVDVRNAVAGDTHDGKPLSFKRGIEVGQVFKLGTKYSAKLDALFLDENGVQKPCLMGCYGIGINRIVASAIETSHDEKGIVWPISIAPFEVEVVALNVTDAAVMEAATALHDALESAGVSVLLDDRDARPGVKFNDADLLGIPVRVTIGPKGLKDGVIEVKLRRDAEAKTVTLAEGLQTVRDLVSQLYAELKAQ